MGSNSDNEIGGWLGIAMLIYLGIGAIAVGGILVWPIVAAVATFIIANKIGIGVSVIIAIIKAKLNGETPENMIKEGLKAGGEATAVEAVVKFLTDTFS
jgi:hypothetical protein